MHKYYYSGLFILLVPCLLFGQGSTYKIGTTVRISERDSLSNNVIAAGQFVDIMGYLNDDLFSASRNITISGVVNDDALVAAQDVRVRGRIGDMLIAVGETVLVEGEIMGDLFAAGNLIRLAPDTRIRGNAALAGNEIIFEGGSINGWMRVTGNEIKLNGSVGNYVELYGNDFHFGENYRPSSSTTITTTREIDREELGSPPEDLRITVTEEEGWVAGYIFGVWFYISLLITGFILIAIFKQTTIDLYRFSTEQYFTNTLYGLLLFLAIPILIVVLMLLILTIPLSVILSMLYGLALLISYLLVSLTLGTIVIRLFRPEQLFADYFWGLALGMILIMLLNLLPFVGWLVNLILLFFGLGTLITYFWKMRLNTV